MKNVLSYPSPFSFMTTITSVRQCLNRTASLFSCNRPTKALQNDGVADIARNEAVAVDGVVEESATRKSHDVSKGLVASS